MADKERRTQKTQPKGKDKDGKPYKPVEIPVPKKDDFDRLLKRASGNRTGEDEKPRE